MVVKQPNKRKEMIILTEKTMGEIYLEPEEETIKNAKEIAVESKTAEKYIFCISYEATEKSVVLSEIKRLECEILEQSDTKTCVTVKASLAQLAAIKSLNCIVKVEMADEYSAAPTENVAKTMTANELELITFTEYVSLAATDEEAISTMCYDGDTDSGCDDSNTMQTAYSLPISSWVNGCICCPGTEVWHRFTASASNAAEYTIYTSGSLDTIGYLYSSNGTLITSNDDGGGNLNFSITEQLTYGATYYVKVKAYGSNTGSYGIRVDYTPLSSSGGETDSDSSNDQATAVQLTLNSWQSDELCCPGAEMWYTFTPSATAYYTVYTAGSLDTVGHIYDADCNQIDSDDDDGTGLNFKMVARLAAGQTYYVKVSAYGNNTGYFSIAVTRTVFVEYVSIDQSYVALDKGETTTLTATVMPSYATNKTLRWETDDASVATVSQNGVITARGAGTTYICAYSQDGSNKSSCCEVSVNVPVKSVTINTSSLLLRVGEYDYLYAEVCPTDAVNKLIRWTSSNNAVVWVNEATGRVEARGIGSATIYATAQDGTGVRGSCAVQVEPPIAVQGIDICCETYTMNVGDTTYLSYDIYPSDATNKSVTWCSTDTSVAEINPTTGRIVAKKAGSTTITVSTDDGCYVDSCLLKVIIDTVTIQKDGAFNKVVFNSSGKVWKCVNCDTIYDDQYIGDCLEVRRAKYNFLTHYNEDDDTSNNTNPKVYTDDEIKLLYAIVPYGVADYVQRYADVEFYKKNGLESLLAYKDRIFKLLFRRDPKYFARTFDGVWNETTDKSNLSAVQSESETIFGMHIIWDAHTVLEVIEAAATMVSIALTIIGANTVVNTLLGGVIKSEKTKNIIAKIFSFTANTIGSGFLSATSDALSEGIIENTALSLPLEIISMFSSLQEVCSDFDFNNNYYQPIMEYCVTELNYDINLEFESGENCSLKDIRNALSLA